MRSAGDVQFIIFKGNLLRLRISMWCQSTTTPQSKPLIYNDFQQKSDSFDSHHDYPHLQFHLRSSRSPPWKPQTNTIQVHDSPSPTIINFTTNPINTNQCSGNHPPTKILDKRTTWILVNNTIQTCYDRKPTSWPPIKIAYAQPTNLDPLPIGSNIEQTLQPTSPRPTSKSQARFDQTNKPSLDTNHLALSIVKHRA